MACPVALRANEGGSMGADAQPGSGEPLNHQELLARLSRETAQIQKEAESKRAGRPS
jgi:hypothetical protein